MTSKVFVDSWRSFWLEKQRFTRITRSKVRNPWSWFHVDLSENAAQSNTSVSWSQLVSWHQWSCAAGFYPFSNRITRDGAVYLAPMLDKCGLLRLNLALNRLENEGAGHLATALLQSSTRLRRYETRVSVCSTSRTDHSFLVWIFARTTSKVMVCVVLPMQWNSTQLWRNYSSGETSSRNGLAW